MSIEVRIPEEIEDYKEKIVAGLSVRQLIWSGIAIAVGVPAYLLLNIVIPSWSMYIAMLLVTPPFLVGFFKKDGYNFETYLKIKLLFFFSKTKRGYETNSNESMFSMFPVECEEYRQIILDLIHEDDIRNINNKEVKKIVWSNKKGQRKNKRIKRKKQSESYFIKISEKDCKRKRKEIYKSIKNATRNNRIKESEKEKTA